MWHLVCGDYAVAGVTLVIGATAAKTRLRVLHDDLAIGPLVDVDTPPCTARATFWQTLWPESVLPVPDFASAMPADARWIAALAEQSQPVTVWHGDSASEQLLLARVAHALEHSPLAFWEVPCGTGDSSVETRQAVAMHTPEALAALAQPREVAAPRRHALAAKWRTAVESHALIRRWQAGEFAGEDYQSIDATLLRHVRDDTQPLARLMTDVMARNSGFFATDYFLYWRVRELAAAGALLLSGEPGEEGYMGLQVRLG